MDNSIFEKQNDPFLLKCLVAQRREYSTAKCANSWKCWLTAAFAMVSIMASLVDVDVLSAFSGLFAICLLIATRYIDAYVEKNQTHAALIQQYFDVSLYSSIFKNETAEWDALPTKTDLAEAVSGIEASVLEPVKNWYSDYSSLEPIQQVFYCQKENLRWDYKLRSEFKKLFMIAFSVIFIVLVITAIIVNPSFVKCICIVSWSLPIADFCLSNYKKLSNDIGRLIKLKEKSDSIEIMINTGDNNKCKSELISLQRQIYKNRKAVVLIPDWFYKLRRSKHQHGEDQIADVIQNLSQESTKQNNDTEIDKNGAG